VALNVEAHRFSKSALQKIEGAGGSVKTIELEFSRPLLTVKKLRKEQYAALREKRAAE